MYVAVNQEISIDATAIALNAAGSGRNPCPQPEGTFKCPFLIVRSSSPNSVRNGFGFASSSIGPFPFIAARQCNDAVRPSPVPM